MALSSAPGDVFAVDARLLHGAYPNCTDEERMLLTLWYHPSWSELPPGLRAHAANVFNGAYSDLAPGAEPSPPGCPPVEFNRRPDTRKMEGIIG